MVSFCNRHTRGVGRAPATVRRAPATASHTRGHTSRANQNSASELGEASWWNAPANRNPLRSANRRGDGAGASAWPSVNARRAPAASNWRRSPSEAASTTSAPRASAVSSATRRATSASLTRAPWSRSDAASRAANSALAS